MILLPILWRADQLNFFISAEPAGECLAVTALTEKTPEARPPASLMTPNSTPAPGAPSSPGQDYSNQG